MSFRAGAQNTMATIRAALARFGRDRRGIAAIEFAFIAPILLAMYFLTMEITQAIETNKKLSRVGSMVADLVTQQGSVTKSDLDAIMKIADTSLLPYHRSTPTMTITGISISSTGKATVDWSRKVDKGVYSVGTSKSTEVKTVPSDLKVAGTYLVQVESDLAYQPMIKWAAQNKGLLGLSSAFDQLSMSETYYLRPRMTATVTCSDCYN